HRRQRQGGGEEARRSGMSTQTGLPGVRRHVGSPVLRVEDPRFLRGQGNFLDDVALPGMLHGAFLRSPHGHARISSVDVAAAAALPGVAAVRPWDDVDAGGAQPFVTALQGRPELKPCTHPQLAKDRVRFVGDAVALVVASSRYVAEDACDLIEVDYEPLPAVT